MNWPSLEELDGAVEVARVGTPELRPVGAPSVSDVDVEALAAPDSVVDSVAGEIGLVGGAVLMLEPVDERSGGEVLAEPAVWLAVVPVYADSGPWPSVVLVDEASAGEKLEAPPLVGEPEVAPASPVV